jgi:hypothetical protein
MTRLTKKPERKEMLLLGKVMGVCNGRAGGSIRCHVQQVHGVLTRVCRMTEGTTYLEETDELSRLCGIEWLGHQLFSGSFFSKSVVLVLEV